MSRQKKQTVYQMKKCIISLINKKHTESLFSGRYRRRSSLHQTHMDGHEKTSRRISPVPGICLKQTKGFIKMIQLWTQVRPGQSAVIYQVMNKKRTGISVQSTAWELLTYSS